MVGRHTQSTFVISIVTIDVTVAIIAVRKLVPAALRGVSREVQSLAAAAKPLPICCTIESDALPTLDADEKQELVLLE